MTSRLLSRLEAAIASTIDLRERDCLRAERAAYLVRLGRANDAQGEIDSLQAGSSSGPVAVVVAWTKFAAGMQDHYAGNDAEALDKWKRAKALTTAIAERRLFRLTCAWLAYLHYTRADMASTINFLAEALAEPGEICHATAARAALIVAQLYHVTRDFDAASPWYTKTRHHAAMDGDDVMISTLIHNMAWVRAFNVRQTILSRLAVASPASLRFDAESTRNFDQLIGLTSLSSLHPLLQAQVSLLEDRYEEALRLLDEHTEASRKQGFSRMQSSFLADRAFCKAKLGLLSDAEVDAKAAQENLAADVQPDDLAATHSRLALVYSAVGSHELAKHHQSLADGLWGDFEKFQQRLSDDLKAVPVLRTA